MTFAIESPDFEDYTNVEQYNYISNYVQQTENAIFGKNFKDSDGISYDEYLDVDSAIDYYWVQEFSLNGDAFGSGSTYLYKKRNGKLYWGPLWDFDYVAWGATEFSGENQVEGLNLARNPWFIKLFSNEKFRYKFIVFAGAGSNETEHKYLQELLSYKIEGLIVLSHNISSKELASYNIPVVAIEREDKYINSINTDNYMGAVQATSLLAKNNCDILIHINSHVPYEIPSYNRIKGFIDICEEHHIKHKLFLEDLGDTYDETRAHIKKIFNIIQKSYPGMRKGIFMANDTHANILINILMCEYGKFTDEYKVVGFDNSPIASEAIIPIPTVGHQIEKIA